MKDRQTRVTKGGAGGGWKGVRNFGWVGWERGNGEIADDG